MKYMHYCLSLLLALSALALSACASFGLPVSGHVLEQGTNKPIPDAIVIVRWEGTIPWSQTACVHVETATTDKNGYFQTHAWHGSSHQAGAIITGIEIYQDAYRPGYELSGLEPSVIYLKPFGGTDQQRYEGLWGIIRATSCDSAGRSKRNMYPLYKAIYYEAKPLATGKDPIGLRLLREVAASAAIAEDGHRTGPEEDGLVSQFLQDHLQ